MTAQPSLSDLVFPSASEQPSLSHLLSDLKRANLSISNRLHSIIQDAEFVREVGEALGGPGPRTSPHEGALKEIDDISPREAVSDGVSKLSLEAPKANPSEVTPRRPLVANERCGSWYVRPSEKGASAYFKSTDGHDNAWKFSTRRLNLQLLEVIGRCDG